MDVEKQGPSGGTLVDPDPVSIELEEWEPHFLLYTEPS